MTTKQHSLNDLNMEFELRRIREITKIGTWYLDLASNEVIWTKELYDMYGFDSTLAPPPYTEHMKLFTQESWQLLSSSLEKTQKTGIPYELELNTFRPRDNSRGWMWVRGEAVKDSSGKIIGLWGAAQDITERKDKELELLNAYNQSQRNEILLNATGEIALIGGWNIDLIKNELSWTKTVYDIHELPLDFVPNVETAINFYEESSKPLIEEAVQNAINKGEPFDLALGIITAKNKHKTVHAKGKAIRNSEGKAVSISGTFQDITERTKLESILQQNKEEITAQNEELQQLNEELATTNEELIAALDLTRAKEQELKGQKAQLEHSNARLESLLRISQFKPDNLQDLLDYALSESILLTKSEIGYIYYYQEANQQFILNTWSKGVMKECQVVNPQTVYDLDKTGCWGEAVRQRKPIILNDYQENNPLKRGTPEGHVKLHRFLTIPVIVDNEIVAVTGVANKKEPYNEKDVRQLSLLMDKVWGISERISLIDDLQNARIRAEESDRLKSSFLANMSHEIRTPMNGILGFTELLADPETDETIKTKYIKLIERSGERLLELINNIIDLSKIEAGQIQMSIKPAKIPEIFESVQAMFAQEAAQRGIEIHLKMDPAANILSTDKNFLEAILINLTKNALKFTQAGRIELGYFSNEKEFQFFVKDTGIGIDPDKMDRIFDRFAQIEPSLNKKFEGAGLGLSISRSYVEMLGGRIWAESESGKGSTFFFTIPQK